MIKTDHPILKSKTGRIDIDLKIHFDKKMTAKVDKCLVPLIEEINEAGFPTLFSCCSHSHEKFYDKQGDEHHYTPYIAVCLRNKIDEKRVMKIVKKHWGKQKYRISGFPKIWKKFEGYELVSIHAK